MEIDSLYTGHINRILIVGLGSIGSRHLRIARELIPLADIWVLRYHEWQSIPDYADGCFSTIEQAVAFAPHIAVIANPAPCHISVAQQLADAEVHMLIEKPLSSSIDGVTQLLEKCLQKGLILMTGYNLRFIPSLQHFRNMLFEDTIGRVLSVRCEIGQYLPTWRPNTDYRKSVSARRELGGGVLLELSHELDYLRWIFGEIEWIRATLCRQSSLEIDVEDTVHLVLGFKASERGASSVGTLNMDFVRHDTTRMCTVIGEKGTLRWNGITGVIDHYPAGAVEWHELFRYQQQRDDSYLAEWEHFLKCIEGSITPMISGNDGLQVLKIIEAARLSSESGIQIQITEESRKRI